MFRKTICSLLACAILFTTACSQQKTNDHSTVEEEFTKSHEVYCVYQDTFYYIKSGIIFYCALEDLEEIDSLSKCLCFDPLCEHKGSGCMGCVGSGHNCISIRSIDGELFLFATYSNLLTDPATYEIARFDIKNADKEILVSGMANMIGNFIVTDTAVVFEENLGGGLTNLHTYSFETQECYTHHYEDNSSYEIIGAYDGNIIYNDNSFNVYINSYRYDNERTLFTGVLSSGYAIYDGYLYFPSNLKSTKLDELTYAYHSASICKTPLSNPSNKKFDIVATDVFTHSIVYSYIFDGDLYYLPCEPSYVGEAKVKYDDTPEMTFTVVNRHNGTMYKVDGLTGEETTVFEDIGYNVNDIVYASDEYIIFASNASGYKSLDNYDSYRAVFVYDRNSEEIYRIRYYGVNKN